MDLTSGESSMELLELRPGPDQIVGVGGDLIRGSGEVGAQAIQDDRRREKERRVKKMR